MKNEEIDILSESEHNQVLEEILQLMNKGEGNLSEQETLKLGRMALAVEKYESIQPWISIE